MQDLLELLGGSAHVTRQAVLQFLAQRSRDCSRAEVGELVSRFLESREHVSLASVLSVLPVDWVANALLSSLGRLREQGTLSRTVSQDTLTVTLRLARALMGASKGKKRLSGNLITQLWSRVGIPLDAPVCELVLDLLKQDAPFKDPCGLEDVLHFAFSRPVSAQWEHVFTLVKDRDVLKRLAKTALHSRTLSIYAAQTFVTSKDSSDLVGTVLPALCRHYDAKVVAQWVQRMFETSEAAAVWPMCARIALSGQREHLAGVLLPHVSQLSLTCVDLLTVLTCTLGNISERTEESANSVAQLVSHMSDRVRSLPQGEVSKEALGGTDVDVAADRQTNEMLRDARLVVHCIFGASDSADSKLSAHVTGTRAFQLMPLARALQCESLLMLPSLTNASSFVIDAVVRRLFSAVEEEITPAVITLCAKAAQDRRAEQPLRHVLSLLPLEQRGALQLAAALALHTAHEDIVTEFAGCLLLPLLEWSRTDMDTNGDMDTDGDTDTADACAALCLMTLQKHVASGHFDAPTVLQALPDSLWPALEQDDSDWSRRSAALLHVCACALRVTTDEADTSEEATFDVDTLSDVTCVGQSLTKHMQLCVTHLVDFAPDNASKRLLAHASAHYVTRVARDLYGRAWHSSLAPLTDLLLTVLARAHTGALTGDLLAALSRLEQWHTRARGALSDKPRGTVTASAPDGTPDVSLSDVSRVSLAQRRFLRRARELLTVPTHEVPPSRRSATALTQVLSTCALDGANFAAKGGDDDAALHTRVNVLRQTRAWVTDLAWTPSQATAVVSPITDRALCLYTWQLYAPVLLHALRGTFAGNGDDGALAETLACVREFAATCGGEAQSQLLLACCDAAALTMSHALLKLVANQCTADARAIICPLRRAMWTATQSRGVTVFAAVARGVALVPYWQHTESQEALAVLIAALTRVILETVSEENVTDDDSDSVTEQLTVYLLCASVLLSHLTPSLTRVLSGLNDLLAVLPHATLRALSLAGIQVRQQRCLAAPSEHRGGNGEVFLAACAALASASALSRGTHQFALQWARALTRPSWATWLQSHPHTALSVAAAYWLLARLGDTRVLESTLPVLTLPQSRVTQIALALALMHVADDTSSALQLPQLAEMKQLLETKGPHDYLMATCLGMSPLAPHTQPWHLSLRALLEPSLARCARVHTAWLSDHHEDSTATDSDTDGVPRALRVMCMSAPVCSRTCRQALVFADSIVPSSKDKTDESRTGASLKRLLQRARDTGDLKIIQHVCTAALATPGVPPIQGREWQKWLTLAVDRDDNEVRAALLAYATSILNDDPLVHVVLRQQNEQ
ncbi:MAG: hypothetical protein MHM6MM_000412 [Cercozoa sp. M6MM]